MVHIERLEQAPASLCDPGHSLLNRNSFPRPVATPKHRKNSHPNSEQDFTKVNMYNTSHKEIIARKYV